MRNGINPGRHGVGKRRLVNTFLDGYATTGTLTSAPFRIEHKYNNFFVGGGSNINETAIRLKVDGQTVHRAAGSNSEGLSWQSWDVGELQGKQAEIEIVDNATGGWGHINVGQISFSDTKATNNTANWLACGPDFYAAFGSMALRATTTP
ncbi:hypothetical protein BJY01DRAFT_253150 [Aspergillus pseudoustus]|uniref:Pectin lyase fold/virulence factor n=1 Tax=Aspergillus pseudoustus TaxID=1810923 RepID=A0ABR4J2S0_9EURO